MIEIIVNLVFIGFIVLKILWVRNNELDIYKNINKIFFLKDYIRYKLIGEYVIEVLDVSGM